MKSPFVRELRPDEIATAIFLVQSKEIRQKRTGEPYLSLVLSDRSGELDSKMWDNVAEVMDTFERDDFVKVKGLLQLYNNRPQFTVHKLRRIEDHEVDFRDFFAASLRDVDEMWRELRSTVSASTILTSGACSTLFWMTRISPRAIVSRPPPRPFTMPFAAGCWSTLSLSWASQSWWPGITKQSI